MDQKTEISDLNRRCANYKRSWEEAATQLNQLGRSVSVVLGAIGVDPPGTITACPDACECDTCIAMSAFHVKVAPETIVEIRNELRRLAKERFTRQNPDHFFFAHD